MKTGSELSIGFPTVAWTRPYEFSRSEAIEIANHYEDSGEGNHERKVTEEAAAFLYRVLERAGWLNEADAVSDDTESPTLMDAEETGTVVEYKSPVRNKTVPRSSLPARKLRPKYLPEISAARQSTPNESAVLDVAYVLSGIDPAVRSEEKTLFEFVSSPEPRHRISRYQGMYIDHRYVLVQHANLEDGEFSQIWNTSKVLVEGDEFDKLLNLCGLLDQVDLDSSEPSPELADVDRLLDEFWNLSPQIVYRLMHAAKSRIAGLHKANYVPPVIEERTDLIGKMQRWLKKPEEVSIPDVEPKVEEAAAGYLAQLIKLGRVLRRDHSNQ